MTNKIDKIQMPDGQVLKLGYSETRNKRYKKSL